MSGINPYGSFILQGLYAGQSSTANAFAVQSAQITDIPSSLKSLATNLILKGEVTSHQSNGNSVITTARGDIHVKLKTQLPVGSKVDIQVSGGSNAREAIIQPSLAKAIHAKQDTPVTQQLPQPQTAPTSTIADVKNLQATATQASQNIINSFPTLTIGQAVRLTLLPVAQQNLLTSAALKLSPPLPITSGILASIPSSHHPIQGTGTSIASPSLGTTITAKPLQIESAPLNLIKNIAPLNSPTLLKIDGASLPLNINGNLSHPNIASLPKTIITTAQSVLGTTQSDARVAMVKPPTVTLNSLMSNPSFTLTDGQTNAGQIIATATGLIDPDGNPIIQTLNAKNQPQLSTLHYPARNLPVGTQIILTPLPSGSVTAPPSSSWQSMAQLNEAMAQIFPLNTLQSLMSLFPNPAQPKSFPAAALLFLAAAKGGDLSGWLGNRVTGGGTNDNAVQNLPKKLIETLMRDIATQTGRAATPADPPMVQVGSDWRAHILPLMVGVDMHQANLWTKDDDRAQSKESEKTKGTRFVVDLTLSRMGDVYFDGFINKDKKIFDLSVITERAITKPMQNTIKSIWYKTINGLDLDGNILFKEST